MVILGTIGGMAVMEGEMEYTDGRIRVYWGLWGSGRNSGRTGVC